MRFIVNNMIPKIFTILTTCLIATASNAAHEMDDRDLEQGKILYSENCASCHGINLEGQPNWRTADENGVLLAPPHDESGHTWHHDDQLLFDYTKFGGQAALAARGVDSITSGMPAAETILSDDEIWTVLAYIRSTWPDRIKRIQAARNPPHN